jgi:hypothetical protein
VRILRAAIALALLWPAQAGAATTRYLSPTGSDTGACASALAPCRNLDYAVGVSQSGDLVEMAAGAYGRQRVSGPADVKISPAAGAAVSVGDLNIDAPTTIAGISASWIDVGGSGAPVTGVTLRGVRSEGLNASDAHQFRMLGGEIGPVTNTPAMQFAGSPASSDIVIDGVDFHDAVATNDTVHMECIWAGGVQNFTVRNSIFRNCAYFDIFFTRLNGPDPKDVLLENNVFEVTKQWNGQNAPFAVNVANWVSKMENFTFRNNTFGGDIALQPGSVVNSRIVGNIGPIGSCKGGVTYHSNVWRARTCGAGDLVAPGLMQDFVDPAAHDWHLKSGADAIGRADPADAPATDRDGFARDNAPDAGAHEYGAGPPAGPPGDGPGPSPGPSGDGDGLPPGVGQGSAPAIKRVRLLHARICRVPKRRCPSKAVLLVTTSAKKVTARIRRTSGPSAGRVRRVHARTHSGRARIKLAARRLRRGRYHVTVVVKGAAGAVSRPASVTLRVR